MAETKPLAHSAATEGSSERRRTQRVQIAMPVIVRCKEGKHPFDEKTQTVSVNANGCLIRLQATVVRGQQVSLINPNTTEELPCAVIFLGKKDGGKTEVGLEFAEASPLFWRISFPPEDWDPSERKRATTPSQLPGAPRRPNPPGRS
jgi:hypothetical protein